MANGPKIMVINAGVPIFSNSMGLFEKCCRKFSTSKSNCERKAKSFEVLLCLNVLVFRLSLENVSMWYISKSTLSTRFRGCNFLTNFWTRQTSKKQIPLTKNKKKYFIYDTVAMIFFWWNMFEGNWYGLFHNDSVWNNLNLM